MLSCAHWLSWRLGMGLTAAHERVRVARAPQGLPLLVEAFGAGQLSWTQVRAVTRVATGADEASWVELARSATGAQLERLVRGVRLAQRIEEDATDPEQAACRNQARISYDEDGTLVISVRLPAEQGAVVLAAVEQARAVGDAQHGPEPSAEDSPPVATVAEGLVQLARIALEAMATARPEAARRGRSRLVAQVDPLSGWARLADGELLPPSSLLGLETPAVGVRRHRKLHAHHVQFWSLNGPTDLANLLLLCPRHHTLVHAQGFQLLLHPDRSLTVRTAQGVPVLHHPVLPWRPAAELDTVGQITARTLPPMVTGQRLDLGYAVAVARQQPA